MSPHLCTPEGESGVGGERMGETMGQMNKHQLSLKEKNNLLGLLVIFEQCVCVCGCAFVSNHNCSVLCTFNLDEYNNAICCIIKNK